MEKIYEEKKQKKQQKQIKIDGTSALSFLVAIFALVSLVSFGISGGLNTSYAIPDVDTIADSFTSSNGTSYYISDMAADPTYVGAIELHYGSVNGGARFPVYCLQNSVNFCGNATYTKNASKPIDDAGLLYLLAHLYPNQNMTFTAANFAKAPTDSNKNDMYQFVSQTAIWYYLNQKKVNKDGTNDDDKIVVFPDATYVHTNGSGGVPSDTSQIMLQMASGKKIYDSFSAGGKTVSQLISTALKLDGNNAIKFEVNNQNIKLSKSTDNKFHITSDISVTGGVANGVDASNHTIYSNSSEIGEYKGYTVAFKGDVPNGSYITDAQGNKKTTFGPGEKFRVYVPSTTESATINLSITGNFEKYTGYYYVSGSCQQVTRVEKVVDHPNTGASFTIAPDTRASSAQTIYFIGLVVLLCGVGIIYANAKPSAQKQVQQQEQ